MPIDGEFLNTLLENVTPKVLTADGKAYSTEQLHNLPLPTEPGFPTIKLETLDSLVDYIKENKDSAVSEDAQVLCGASVVQLFSKPWGQNRRRDILAEVHSGASSFPFSQYQNLETFRIGMMTQFAPVGQRDEILAFIAKVDDEHVKTSQDNGISQTVSVRVGLVTVAEKTIPSPVQLAPIRTFIEVEQPMGGFIFRMKSGKELPEAALFEIHTNWWKREAAVRVKDYLAGKLDIPVLA